MYDTTAIKAYILYLKKECNLSVTLHSFRSKIILYSDLIHFNIHENPYCICIKSCESAHNHCIEKQAKILEKCKDGSFTGVCYAGVKEYVYPFKHNQKVIGFICVSGYADEQGDERIRAVSKKYALSNAKLHTAYQTLKKQIPDKVAVDTLIEPLCAMLELLHLKYDNVLTDDDGFIQGVLHFLKQNYTQPIHLELLCKRFRCSPSHLSHTFNATMKTGIKQYINELRIKSAKTLLRDTQLDVAEIALSVGFSEPNYFTAIFKKHTGVSPSLYRNQTRK